MHKSKKNYVTTYWYTNYMHIKRTILIVHSLQTDHIKNEQTYSMNMTFLPKFDTLLKYK